MLAFSLHMLSSFDISNHLFTLQCSSFSPFFPFYGLMGKWANTPHSYHDSKASKAIYQWERWTKRHHPLLFTNGSSLTFLPSGKWASKSTEEKVGGGLRHLCNRAPKFQQVGDFRERWNAPKSFSPPWPFLHINSQGPIPACSFIRTPPTHSHILPEKEKPE